jgi:hypothetical protein
MEAVRSSGLVLHLVTCMNPSTTLIDWLTSISIMPTAQLHSWVKKYYCSVQLPTACMLNFVKSFKGHFYWGPFDAEVIRCINEIHNSQDAKATHFM